MSATTNLSALHPDKIEELLLAARLAQSDGNTKKGLATVSLESILDLLRNVSLNQKPSPPKQIIYLDTQYVGETVPGTNHVKFDCKMDILLTSKSWVAIPLLPSQVALVSFHIQQFGPDGSLATLAKSDSDDHDHDRTAATFKPSIALINGHHSLIATTEGRYAVSLVFLAPYASLRNASLSLAVPVSAKTSLDFTAHSPNLSIVVASCLSQETPANQLFRSRVVCTLAPTSTIDVQWTRKLMAAEGSEAQAQPKLPLTVTVEQHHLLSIVENIAVVSSQFEYTIHNGSVSSLEIYMDSDLRLLNVETSSGAIKRWDVTTYTSADPEYDILDAELDEPRSGKNRNSAKPRLVLKVVLEYGVENSFELRVSTEKELPATSCRLDIPRFKHVRSAVTREKGYIAVESSSNIEVEHATGALQGASLIDIGELPTDLRTRASTPLLFAFKYLLPTYTIGLDIKRHADVDVLVASIEEAHFIAMFTEQGKSMYQLLFSVSNTQQQYLRIALDPRYEIWTIVVGGQAVKPVKDKETGEVMIPLEKAGSAKGAAEESSSSQHVSFLVEVVYVCQFNLSDGGDLSLRGGQTAESSRDELRVSNASLHVLLASRDELRLRQVSAGASTSTGDLQDSGTHPTDSVGDIHSVGNAYQAAGASDGAPRVAPVAPLGASGEISVRFPKVDVPINQLFVCVHLPEIYQYGEFEGDMKEISYYSTTPMAKVNVTRTPREAAYPRPQLQSQLMSNVAFASNISYDRNFAVLDKSDTIFVARNRKTGVVPVKVEMVTTGKPFYFERLLVVGQPLQLTVPYKQSLKLGRPRRRIDPYCAIC